MGLLTTCSLPRPTSHAVGLHYDSILCEASISALVKKAPAAILEKPSNIVALTKEKLVSSSVRVSSSRIDSKGQRERHTVIQKLKMTMLLLFNKWLLRYGLASVSSRLGMREDSMKDYSGSLSEPGLSSLHVPIGRT